MKCFVNCRGFQHDYSWLAQDETPFSLECFDLWLGQELEVPSLFLYRVEREFFLLLTKIPCAHYDRAGRKIRAHFIFRFEQGLEEERLLRAIICAYLEHQDYFLAALGESLSDDNSTLQGFSVNWRRVKTLLDVNHESFDSHALTPDDEEAYIAQDNTNRRNELILMLRQFSLPKNENLLLVVGEALVDFETEKNTLWRGLFSYSESSCQWRVLEVTLTGKKLWIPQLTFFLILIISPSLG